MTGPGYPWKLVAWQGTAAMGLSVELSESWFMLQNLESSKLSFTSALSLFLTCRESCDGLPEIDANAQNSQRQIR